MYALSTGNAPVGAAVCGVCGGAEIFVARSAPNAADVTEIQKTYRYSRSSSHLVLLVVLTRGDPNEGFTLDMYVQSAPCTGLFCRLHSAEEE